MLLLEDEEDKPGGWRFLSSGRVPLKGKAPLLGVLQCATKNCEFRVTNAWDIYCCEACSYGGERHDAECARVPLHGLTEDERAGRGFGDNQQFAARLRDLLKQKGALHVAQVPSNWDKLYGEGAWQRDRPQKSVLKACTASHISGVAVLNQVAHLVEDASLDGPETQQTMEADQRTFQSLTEEAKELLQLEFEAALRGQEVLPKLARISFRNADGEARSTWRCLLQPLSCTDEDGDDVASPRQDEQVTFAGYGGTAEDAEMIARLRLLESLQRWEMPSASQCLAIKLERQLQNRALELLCACRDPELDLDALVPEETYADCTDCVKGLVDALDEVLQSDHRCRASCWALLARSWSKILSMRAADDLALVHKLLGSLRLCKSRPTLQQWSQLAEEATFQTEVPALEKLEEIQTEESETPAGAYARRQLFSLLLELQEQIKQELERSTAAEQRVVATWNLREGNFSCTFTEALKGKVDAVLLSTSTQDSGWLLCEALDESKMVVRAVLGVGSASSPLIEVMRSSYSAESFGAPQKLRCKPLAIYAGVASRQREALRALLREKEASPYNSIIRDAVVGSWWAVNGVHEPARRKELLQECAKKAGSPPGFNDDEEGSELEFETEEEDEVESVKAALTPMQRAAVSNAESRRISLVRGPPGTGKTHVAAAIALAVSANFTKDQRVLAVTQSHAAAINLHRRLEHFGVAAARVGWTLTAQEVVSQKIFEVMRSGREEDEESDLLIRISSSARAEEKDGLRSKEQQRAHFVVMRRMARLSQVIVMTFASSGNAVLLQSLGEIPLLLVDEAAQCVEPGLFVPLNWGSVAFALVGDEKQLPATILSKKASQLDLGVSIFERFVRDEIVSLGNGFVQLDEQQRMHPSIARFPCDAFYGGTIRDGAAMSKREPIPGFPWPVPGCHVAFVECGYMTGEEGGMGGSHSNYKEANVLLTVLKRCLAKGTLPSQVGIITGYSAQQALLQKEVAKLGLPGLRVDTVDGFQGAERDLILASTVRSHYKVGFMRDPRRVNVLLTRAKRGLVVFGNGTTLNSEMETWRPWLTWIREQGAQMSAEQLVGGVDFPGGLDEPWGEDPWEAPRLPVPTDDRTIHATSSPAPGPLPPAAFPSSNRPASFPPVSTAPSRPASFPPAATAASGPIGPIRPSQAASFPTGRTYAAAAHSGTTDEVLYQPAQPDRKLEDLVAAKDDGLRMRQTWLKTAVSQPAPAAWLEKDNWTEYAAEDGRIWEHNEVTGESRWKEIEKL